MDEVIVFLMRQFGWTLEYATELVSRLEIGKLNALIQEVQYQKAVDDYVLASKFAMLIANWASAQGRRRYKITEFIGQKPRRSPRTREEKELAQKAAIKELEAFCGAS